MKLIILLNIKYYSFFELDILNVNFINIISLNKYNVMLTVFEIAVRT